MQRRLLRRRIRTVSKGRIKMMTRAVRRILRMDDDLLSSLRFGRLRLEETWMRPMMILELEMRVLVGSFEKMGGVLVLWRVGP